MEVTEPNAFTVVITLDFTEAIDLYLYLLGYRNEDTEEVSAALQVRLSGIVE